MSDALPLRMPQTVVALRPKVLEVDGPVAAIGAHVSVAAAPFRRRSALAMAKAADALAESLRHESDARLVARAAALAGRLRREGTAGAALAETLAVAREIGGRKLGTRPFVGQLAGAAALVAGGVIEMDTGEGKTLTGYLAAAAYALAGRIVHVVTANDYLADRDATELRPALEALGLTVGVVAHGLSPSDRRRAYQANVTFVCNKEVAFDYLRDRLLAEETDGDPVARLKARRALGLATERGDPVLRGLDVAIVDEVDSVLIDDAGTPLIISTEVDDAVDDGTAQEAVEIARGLVPGGDFVIDGLSSLARLTPAGEVAVDEAALERGGLWRQRIRRHELVAAALTAAHALEADRHYIVRDGKIVMIDQYSGRTMPDRYWGHDLHRMVEWKEGLPAGRTRRSLASISFQRFFRSYRTLAGMSGTVREVAVELARVYGLRLTRIPRRLPLQRAILPRRFFGDRDQLWHEAAATVRSLSSAGRPVLIGVRSVAEAERASAALNAANVRHALLSAAHDREEAEIVAGAGQAGTVTIATNMAGRGTDIRLGRDVAGKGGLAVMICERHDSRRVDRQLMGRCARQGDPGAVIEMLSREDELLTLSPAWMQRLLDLRPFGEETVALVARLAQRRMERMQYRRRLDLVRRDKRLAKMLAFAGGLG